MQTSCHCQLDSNCQRFQCIERDCYKQHRLKVAEQGWVLVLEVKLLQCVLSSWDRFESVDDLMEELDLNLVCTNTGCSANEFHCRQGKLHQTSHHAHMPCSCCNTFHSDIGHLAGQDSNLFLQDHNICFQQM